MDPKIIRDILHEIDGIHDIVSTLQGRVQDIIFSMEALDEDICSLRAYVEDMDDEGGTVP